MEIADFSDKREIWKIADNTWFELIGGCGYEQFQTFQLSSFSKVIDLPLESLRLKTFWNKKE